MHLALWFANQALPGAAFRVAPRRRATQPSAELRVNGVCLLGKLDGEFARGAQTYAGTGTIRYAW